MNHIIRISKKTYSDFCTYLIENFQFKDFCLSGKTVLLPSKIKILTSLFRTFFILLSKRKRFNRSKRIVCFGYSSLTLILFNKLHLLRFQRIYWVGFFFHNPRYLIILRWLLKAFSNDKLHFIVFSKYERELYSHSLGIRNSNLHYFPYGDFTKVSESVLPSSNQSKNEDLSNQYFFSGGYSNRDYRGLIDVFRKINRNLVIVCSKNNKDILNIEIPENITIHTDLPSEQFDKYLRDSMAVILPFKYNSGASGQSVMLRCMRNRKAVIVTETEIIKEYVEDGVSGLIIKDLNTQLADKIQYLEENKKTRDDLGINLYLKYAKEFSYEAITPFLRDIINET